MCVSERVSWSHCDNTYETNYRIRPSGGVNTQSQNQIVFQSDAVYQREESTDITL